MTFTGRTNYHYVYAHIDRHGDIRYVGKGCGSRAWVFVKRNKWWNAIFYGYKPTVKMLCIGMSAKDACEHEIAYIEHFRNLGMRLCNISDGGDNGLFGYKATPEHCAKLSESLSGIKNPFYGRHHSKESIEKMKQTKRERLTDEVRKKMRESSKKRLTPEVRAKISASLKGRTLSEETKAKLSEYHKAHPISYMKGKHLSEETKKKKSIAMTAWWKKRRGNNHA